jgi:capsule polysaccharide modification protein KpsS
MFHLIKDSIGTINLSSTVGLESLIIKKPTILLGNVFYNDTGLTFKVDSYTQLQEVLKQVNNENYNLDDTFENYDERLAYYLNALNEKSYPFEFNVAKMDTKKKVMTQENIQAFSKCIETILS